MEDAENPAKNEAPDTNHVTSDLPLTPTTPASRVPRVTCSIVNINNQIKLARESTTGNRNAHALVYRPKSGYVLTNRWSSCSADNPANREGLGLGIKPKGGVPRPESSFPGRRSAYVETSKQVTRLASARGRTLGGRTGPGSGPEEDEFRLRRRTNSAPVLVSGRSTPSGAPPTTGSQNTPTPHTSREGIRKSSTSTNLLTTVSVNDWLSEYKAMRSQGWKPDTSSPAVAGNGLPKSYPKMMEFVKNLRMKSQARSVPGQGDFEFTVFGSSQTNRDPINAWSPMSISLYEKFDHMTESGFSSPLGEKTKSLSTPAHSTTDDTVSSECREEDESAENTGTVRSSGSVDADAEETDEAANQVLSLYDEASVHEKISYSKDYEEGTGQLLKYYINKEHRESMRNDRHSSCGSHGSSRRLESRERHNPRTISAPNPSPVHSRALLPNQPVKETPVIKTRPGGFFMGRQLRVGSATKSVGGNSEHQSQKPGQTGSSPTRKSGGGYMSIHRPAFLAEREENQMVKRGLHMLEHGIRIPQSSLPRNARSISARRKLGVTHAQGYNSGTGNRNSVNYGKGNLGFIVTNGDTPRHFTAPT